MVVAVCFFYSIDPQSTPTAAQFNTLCLWMPAEWYGMFDASIGTDAGACVAAGWLRRNPCTSYEITDAGRAAHARYHWQSAAAQ